jgi:hypothetical protein
VQIGTSWLQSIVEAATQEKSRKRRRNATTMGS